MRIFSFFAFLLAAQSAVAQVYKWVDSRGVTHYGERAPTSGKATEVRLQEASPRVLANAAPSAHAASIKERELEFRKRQAQRERDEVQLAEEKAKRDDDCRSARADLADLRNTRLLYDLNNRGERVYMSDAQRDAEVARREADYNRRCG